MSHMNILADLDEYDMPLIKQIPTTGRTRINDLKMYQTDGLV